MAQTKRPVSTRKPAKRRTTKKIVAPTNGAMILPTSALSPAIVKASVKSVKLRATPKQASRKKSVPKSRPKKIPTAPEQQAPAIPLSATPDIQPPRTTSQPLLASLRTLLRTPRFGKLFMVGCLLLLLATVLFWTVLSARLNQANADQLIDAYLFDNVKTFHAAIFPGEHTFLLKWPLFILMRLFGDTPTVFMAATIAMVLATIGLLVYILSKIETRPIVFGLFCLALASILLLVPAQPYAGALLPVNMAMTTTRNLEYALYIVAVYYAIRARRLESAAFIAVIACVAVVVASDKLFAVLAVGSGILAAVWYLSRRGRRPETMAAVRWLLMALIGIVVSSIVLGAFNKLHITHISNSESASPYELVHSAKQLATAVIYGFAALLTNFGANPVHGVTVIRAIPLALWASLRHISIIGYAVNLLLLLAGLSAVVKLLWADRATSADWYNSADHWTRLSVFLLGSTLAAGAVFVITNHYYPVDARYLTIALFAITIAAASYWRTRRPRPIYLAALALIVLLGLPTGMLGAWHEYKVDESALSTRNHVTTQVADELQLHKVNRLVGDYWDITPAKADTVQPLTIAPVDQCNTPRPVLDSSNWFKQPATTSTAYLAVEDGSPAAGPDGASQSSDTTYNGCSLAHIVSTYGVPSERVAINQAPGSKTKPDVLLLLYPNGLNPPLAPSATPAPAAQPAVSEIQSLVPFSDTTACDHGTTLQIVAHEDDDLLFMNPDEQATIKAGTCLRTVYVTAGDAGQDASYWGAREEGAMAAYAEMYGVADSWQSEQEMLLNHKVTIDFLKNVPQVALVFLRLPDGDITGDGFAADKYQSLQKLINGTIPTITAVDGSTSYTKQQLIGALHEIMVTDLPDQIRTQGSSNLHDGDHADHHDVGILTDLAASTYIQPHTMTHYLGYPDKLLPVNLSADEITTKQLTFLTYAKYDGAVCQTAYECQTTYTYGSYLTRQYQPQVIASHPTPSGVSNTTSSP